MISVDRADVFAVVGTAHVVILDGEAVILEIESDRLHVLNSTATLVWQCLDGFSTVESICFDLAKGLEVELACVLADTSAVLADLVSEGLALRVVERWQRRFDALTRTSLDSLLILASGSDEPFALAGSGVIIWDLLEDPISSNELVERLATQFGVEQSVVRSDVEALLELLACRKAIERVPALKVRD